MEFVNLALLIGLVLLFLMYRPIVFWCNLLIDNWIDDKKNHQIKKETLLSLIAISNNIAEKELENDTVLKHPEWIVILIETHSPSKIGEFKSGITVGEILTKLNLPPLAN